jgi:hypothetical protein
MANPSYTYTLTNGTTADASQVMQNFNDILNGVTDGTKDLSISALTVAGTATFNGNVNVGNASADDLTITASLASTVAIKTNNSYDIGSATLGLRKLYLGNGGAGATCDIVSASHATTREYTVPDCGAAASFLMTAVAQSVSGVKTFTVGQIVDGTADEIQFRVQGNGTQTTDILVVEKSDGTDLLEVTNVNGTKIRGTTTNDDAATGFVGEYLIQSRLRSANTSLTTDTGANVTATALTLTAGDWEIGGSITYGSNTTTSITILRGAISKTSATLPAGDTGSVPTLGEIRVQQATPAGVPGANDITLPIPTIRASISGSTTFYLMTQATFSVSTLVVWGAIWARRIR